MSDEKKYSAEDVARKILDSVYGQIKKSEILEKSKNKAHEIDAGEEPKNDDAECPEYLAGKSEMSEESSMEDEPLQGDSDSDTEDEEEKEKEDEKEEEEADEDDFEFEKSESDMAKSDESPNISTKRFETGEKKMTNEGAAEVKRTSQNPKETGKKFQDSRKQMGMWRSKKFKETGDMDYLKGHHDHKYEKSEHEDKDMDKCGDMPKSEGADQEAKETKGIDFDKPSKSDKAKEEEKNIKRPMEKGGKLKKFIKNKKMDKCGDMVEAKMKSDKLKKFLDKKAKK